MTTLYGQKVLIDATIVMKDGCKTKLKDGERIDLDGKISPVPKQNYITMLNNKMLLIRDTIMVELKNEMVLENGSKVLPSGFLIDKNGKKMAFKEGSKITMEGKWSEGMAPETNY